MNAVYTILESPYRWWILTGLAFTAASVGAVAMLSWGWPHTLELIWFYAGFFCSLFFLTRAVLDWKDRLSVSLDGPQEGHRADRRERAAASRPARRPKR